MKGKIASWWMPDEVVFVDEIPHTATGKIQKNRAAGALQGFRPAWGSKRLRFLMHFPIRLTRFPSWPRLSRPSNALFGREERRGWPAQGRP